VTQERIRAFVGVLASLGAVMFAPEASAAEAASDTGSTAIAVRLFDQAEQLTIKGKHAEACPKYAESYRLDPQLGVLLYLAECYEKVGRLASAWATFRNAEELAQKNDDSRASTAKTRVMALEPRLSRLVVRVPGRRREIAVSRNGDQVHEAQWGTPVPVDAGLYRIEARQGARTIFARDVQVKDEGATVEVEIPLGTDPDRPTEAPTRASQETSRFTTGVLVAGGATLLLASGTAVTGALYLGKRSDFHDANAGTGPVEDKRALRDDAATIGLVSTALGAATLVGAGITAYLYVSAGSSREQRHSGRGVRFAPWTGPSAAGIVVGGEL
jgi:hypothetical protein